MRGRKGSSLTLILALAAAILWIARPKTPTRESATAASFSLSSAVAKPESALEQARRFIQRKNEQASKERKAFESDGWAFVDDARPPNTRVLELDPDALPQFEAEIQVQLQSTTYSGAMLEKVGEIYRRTTDPKTRYVALEALGRSDEPAAQHLLIDFFEQDARESERRQILGYLRPQRLDDFVARFLLQTVANESLSDQMRQQAVFPLVMRSLLQGQTAPSSAMLEHVPPKWRVKLKQMFEMVRNGSARRHS